MTKEAEKRVYRSKRKISIPFSIELPVQFRDLDCSGHVNSVAYLLWMESARVEFMRELGGFNCFQRSFIIASTQCKYRKPMIREHNARISIWVSRIGITTWDFDYLVCGSTGGRFATGRTTQEAYDFKKGTKCALSQNLRNTLMTDLNREKF